MGDGVGGVRAREEGGEGGDGRVGYLRRWGRGGVGGWVGGWVVVWSAS